MHKKHLEQHTCKSGRQAMLPSPRRMGRGRCASMRVCIRACTCAFIHTYAYTYLATHICTSRVPYTMLPRIVHCIALQCIASHRMTSQYIVLQCNRLRYTPCIASYYLNMTYKPTNHTNLHAHAHTGMNTHTHTYIYVCTNTLDQI